MEAFVCLAKKEALHRYFKKVKTEYESGWGIINLSRKYVVSKYLV